MIATAYTLAVFIAAPASAAGDCALEDHRCRAERSERRAEAASTPDQRALFLHSAHRSYLFLFHETGQAPDLCDARRALDESLAVEGQTTSQRTRHQAGRATLVALERKLKTRCTTTKKQRTAKKPDSPIVAASATASPTPPVVTAADDAVPPFMASSILTGPRPPSGEPPPPSPEPRSPVEHPPSSTTAGPSLGEHSPPSPEPRSLVERRPSSASAGPSPDDALLPVPRRRATPHDAQRPGRGLVIAGGVVLGVGVALTVAAGYTGHRWAETRQRYLDLHDMVDGLATTEQDAMAGVLLRDYRTAGDQALALAVAGGTTVVIAAVLAGVGGRRMARAASRTALVPVPGGLALHARF